jgi:hypothetical protein
MLVYPCRPCMPVELPHIPTNWILELIRDASSTAPELTTGPADALLDSCVELLSRRHSSTPAGECEAVPALREALQVGLVLAALPVGSLIQLDTGE